MEGRRGALWRHPDFLKLWAAQTVSEVGSQVTLLALPLAAIEQLHASNAAVGALRTVETLPFLLFGLPAGVWVDRWRRRKVLLGTDLARAIVLASVPAAWALGWLALPQLLVVAFVTGILTTVFDVAYQSFLPRLVARDDLVDANTKLGLSQSGAAVAGPGIAGLLVSALGAASAVGLDAASFLASAVGVGWISRPEEAASPARGDRAGLVAQVREGLGFVLGHPQLRLLAGCTATYNLFLQGFELVLLLYLARSLGLGAREIGIVLVASSVGYVAGSLVAGRIGLRLGMGRIFTIGIAVSGLGAAGAPLFGRGSVVLLAVALWINSFGVPLYNINQLSLRQSICPDRLQARMNATMRFLVWGTLPVGSLLGGLLAATIGIHPALWVTAGGEILAVAWTLPAPLRLLREIPEPLTTP